ncbi:MULTISPECIES: outer membrane protein assembly factor BamA [unclassified Variovorax]|jgi:outer membrane protein insertion porin family|uniref:outer membrane protein assembly factor BamA n=1 Tax=unclassified Variovorax TaxID=663243 RepID=UPI0008CB20F3|nr:MULTISPECIES: outer membrane protein assembly factor BamA [unclassified Variovorax]SEK04210.1 Beta-barrel assembly machine subunit BamA [Variovorax sp. OK202]SFD38826.1 Beta-barrel assembly machine subunit BamA [Variovorax sp. OK212]
MNKNFNRFRLRSVAAVVVSALAATAAWAVEPFTVRDIRVEGLQRVEAGTIFASLPLRVGDTYSDERGSAAIRALFDLGLFKDVRIDVNGNVLVVIVEERPTIADVDFVGTKEFDKAALQKALREVGLADGRPYDKALADRAEQELKRQYVSRSLYNAQVVTTVTPIERNRVNLTFTVTEGDSARIREVHVVGSKAFSESTLLSLFDQDSGGFMSWYTKSNQYSRAKLNADLETLRSYYITRGYLEFRIDSTQVAISPDRKDLTVTVNITEGEKFVVSSVKLDGNYLGRDDDFKSLITIKPGEPYNGEQVTETTKAFNDYFGTFGYAFARVQARPEIDRVNNRVALTLQAEPARRVYVRRVSVGGNNKTRDEVIRREFRQFEASWYDGDKIKLSRDRVDRLGFFTEVNVDTQEVAGSPDQVDLTVNVAEKPTGSLQLGAGYSSAEKVALTFGISQENVFGSGNFLGVQVNTSKYNRTLSLTTTDPYFTQDGISRTISLYHTTTRPYSSSIDGDYKLVNQGGSIRFGVPFSEVDTVFFGVGLERYAFDANSSTAFSGLTTPPSYLSYFQCKKDPTGILVIGCDQKSVWGVPLSIGWGRDSRDSALIPTTGRLQRANLEVGAAGDMKYVKTNYQYQQFFAINKQYTFSINGEVGYAKALGNKVYPIFKNFYAGGLGSIRGFEQNSLGPRDLPLFGQTEGAAIGGTKKAIFNAELSTPFPGAGNDRTLRLYGFFDIGNVFGSRAAGLTDAQWKAEKKLRASVGLGVSWISPLGPLRLAYAFPVMSQKEVVDPSTGFITIPKDRIQRLQFQIGTSF